MWEASVWREQYVALCEIIVDTLVSTLTQRGSVGHEPGTHAWLARQPGALSIAPRPLHLKGGIKSG